MPRLTELAHDVVRAVVKHGDIAIDATAGNGRDTWFLAELVGPGGHVFACDIQREALDRTRAAVKDAANVTLLLCDHAGLAEAIPSRFHGQIAAAMFNLGYFPGGNKSITTLPESTLKAIACALDLLAAGGILTIVAYTGHPGGKAESDAVVRWLGELSHDRFAIDEIGGDSDHASPPRLFVVRRRG